MRFHFRASRTSMMRNKRSGSSVGAFHDFAFNSINSRFENSERWGSILGSYARSERGCERVHSVPLSVCGFATAQRRVGLIGERTA